STAAPGRRTKQGSRLRYESPELSLPSFILELPLLDGHTVPKDSFSTVSAVEVFIVTLARGSHKTSSSVVLSSNLTNNMHFSLVINRISLYQISNTSFLHKFIRVTDNTYCKIVYLLYRQNNKSTSQPLISTHYQVLY
ncbi:hypothetical protein L9F63_016134, partial [Diploptera punctata]